MDRGYLGGLANQIGLNPQAGQMAMGQPEQAAQQQGGAYGYELPDKLAVRREKLNKLLNDYSLLKQFATEMSQKGIDPFAINYGEDDGGLAFQTLMDLDASVRYGAMELSNEREAEERLGSLFAQDKLRFKPGVNTQEDIAYSNPENYYSTSITPGLEQTNKVLGDDTYSQRDSARMNQLADLEMQKIDSQVQQGFISPERGEYLKAQLVPNRNKTHPSAYNPNNRGDGAAEKKSMLNLFQRVANHTRGVFPDGTFKPRIVGGKQFAESRDFAGDNYGRKTIYKQDSNGNILPVEQERKIVSTLKDEQGKTFFLLDDGEMVDVSAKTPDEVFRTIVESNSTKYGGASALPALYNELERNQLLDSNRTVPSNTVFGEGSAEQANKVKANIPGFDKIQKALKNDYDKVVANGTTVTVEGEDGTVYKFSKSEDDGVYLTNWKEVGGYKKEDRPKFLSYGQFLDFIDQSGYWNKWLPNYIANQNKTGKSKTPDNLTARQQQAILQFSIQFKRDPNQNELDKILAKYK
jgi:hypothetical protein